MLRETSTTPERDSARLNRGGSYGEAGHIETQSSEQVSKLHSMPSGKISARWWAVFATASVMALCTAGNFIRDASLNETQHKNWEHVAAANRASTTKTNQLLRVGDTGAQKLFASVEVSSADKNRAVTRRVRSALIQNDVARANAYLQSGQETASAPHRDVKPATLRADSPLVDSLRDGRSEFFEIELFDCCDEDGDVVEMDVNGIHFASVPLRHVGTLLSIPLNSGNNIVTIRGTYDGGGGVTLSLRTSRGHFFARHMRVGQEYQIGVTVQ